MWLEIKLVSHNVNCENSAITKLINLQATMEHPFLSLATKEDFRYLEYENNGSWIKISPSSTARETVPKYSFYLR